MGSVRRTYGDLGSSNVRDDGGLEVFGRLSSHSDGAGSFGDRQRLGRPVLGCGRHVRLQQKRSRDRSSLGDHLAAASAAAGYSGQDARPTSRVDHPDLPATFLSPLASPSRGPARSFSVVSGPLSCQEISCVIIQV